MIVICNIVVHQVYLALEDCTGCPHLPGQFHQLLGRNINVQPTAMARRIFRSRGKGAARTGRRIQDQESGKRQIVLDENDDENVYFSLPKQKKRKTQQKHSLKNSVDENRPNPKKH